MCEVLGVSTSGYYYWQAELKDDCKIADLDAQIKTVFEESRETYGSLRIVKVLQQKGVEVSESEVARRMRALEITPAMKKRFKSTTDSKHDMPTAANILNRSFKVSEIGRVWVSDITYIRVGDSFVYLTTVIDLADRMVIGWSLSKDMTDKNTVIMAFKRALINRKLEVGAIFHSDRGSQYASKAFRQLLRDNLCIQSMSRKGNCWDNAVAESFFKTIKTESLYRYKFSSFNQVYSTVFDYIDGWYNTMRIHSALGDKSPQQMSLYLNAKKMAA
jgi:putative transposase